MHPEVVGERRSRSRSARGPRAQRGRRNAAPFVLVRELEIFLPLRTGTVRAPPTTSGCTEIRDRRARIPSWPPRWTPTASHPPVRRPRRTATGRLRTSKFLLPEFGKHQRRLCYTTAIREKAAVNAPHSKRFAKFEDAGFTRQRLECGGFSTAFGGRAWPFTPDGHMPTNGLRQPTG